MRKKANKISTRWIRETRTAFREFLDETDFPDPERMGRTWSGIQISRVADNVHCYPIGKVENQGYVRIHEMAVTYWDLIAEGFDLKPISERQLRERLKKIRHFPGKPAAFIFSAIS